MNKQIISFSGLLILLATLFLTAFKSGNQQDTNVFITDFSDKNQYHFLEVSDHIKMAYLDIGNKDDPIVLLLHGEPASAYLYRNIAPQIAKKGFRVIIPDLIGFGYSDKPENPDAITYSSQTEWLTNFIARMKLSNIHLYAHDWGGMIGLRIVARHQDKFKKVAVSYAYLFEGNEMIPESFLGFKNYAKNEPAFSAGNIINWGSNKKIPDTVKAVYDSYFTAASDYNAVRKFPSMIPTEVADKEAILNRELNKELGSFEKPFITIWGNHEDLMWKGKDILLQNSVAGARNRTHYILDASHFLQEDQADQLSQILIRFFE